MRCSAGSNVDVVMLGSFGVWTRGTLQSRALPLARAISAATNLQFAIVTTPWDDPSQAGVRQAVDGVAIHNTRATDLRQAPSVVWEQLNLVHRLQPSLVHVMKPKAAAGMTADLLVRAGRIPHLLVDYDDWEGDGGWNDQSGYPILTRRLFSYQERRLIRAASAVTAASTLLELRARRLREQYANDGVVFLPNGLEQTWMADLRNAAQRNRRWDAPRLVLYSRFAEYSPSWLGQVVTRIDQDLSAPVDLDVIGSDGIEALLPGSLRWIRPRWHGYVARGAIPEILGTATIALYPYDDNLINRAKQSVKLLELMASGSAIVASDVGDIRRIGGDTLISMPPGDSEAFAGAVVDLLIDPQRAEAMGRRAAERASEFGIDHLAGRLHGLYQRFGLA